MIDFAIDWRSEKVSRRPRGARSFGLYEKVRGDCYSPSALIGSGGLADEDPRRSLKR